MPTKLSLTLDLPTLVTLLGSDVEAVIELRKGIVATFARTHLKPLVNHDIIRTVVAELRRDMQREAKEAVAVFFQDNKYQSAIELTTYAKLTIAKEVLAITGAPLSVIAVVREEVRAQLFELGSDAIAKRVEEFLTKNGERYIEEMIKDRVEVQLNRWRQKLDAAQ